MPNRIQTLRSSVAGTTPAVGTRQPGELWLNFPDSQLGFINAAQIAQKLLAVRLFANSAIYSVGDFVVQSGDLYKAIAPSAPGTFQAANWVKLGTMADLSGYLPLIGGTLTGPLVLAANPSANLQAATKQYVDTGVNARLPIAGGTMTGPLILSEAPTQAMEAATKSYVDAGTFLPISGGTLTGALGGTTASFSGAMSSVGATITGTLNGVNGSFSTQVSGGTVYSSGNVIAGGSLYPNYNANNAGFIRATGGDTTMYFNGSNYVSAQNNQLVFLAAGNAMSFNGNLSCPGTIGASGSITANNGMQCNGNFQASGIISPNNGGSTFFIGGSNPRQVQWSGSWYIGWRTSDGLTYFQSPSGSVVQIDGSGNLVLATGNGFKPGGGAWAATSDDRTKQDVGPYASGLDEIMQIEPIAFRYNGKGGTPDDGKVYYGVSAQATKPVMPELVVEMTHNAIHPLSDATERDSDLLEGQLGTELGPLSLALVNAVKTLAARVAALEGEKAGKAR